MALFGVEKIIAFFESIVPRRLDCKKRLDVNLLVNEMIYWVFEVSLSGVWVTVDSNCV